MRRLARTSGSISRVESNRLRDLRLPIAGYHLEKGNSMCLLHLCGKGQFVLSRHTRQVANRSPRSHRHQKYLVSSGPALAIIGQEKAKHNSSHMMAFYATKLGASGAGRQETERHSTLAGLPRPAVSKLGDRRGGARLPRQFSSCLDAQRGTSRAGARHSCLGLPCWSCSWLEVQRNKAKQRCNSIVAAL